jgi:hypothetical protein
VSRPERSRPPRGVASCCVRLAGASPVAVSAGAPRSRPRAWGEIPTSERGVKSPPGAIWFQRRGATSRAQCESVNPAASRDRQPKGGAAEPIIPRRRQKTAPERAVRVPVVACDGRAEADRTGGVQGAPGVRGRARGESLIRNRRDPTRQPTSGEGGAHKPMAKGSRAGRESEELIVPVMERARTSPEGRGSALVTSATGVSARA